jgi:hypothetical protein
MLDCADTVRGNREYFRDLDHQMEKGGLAAMIYDLLKRDISTFDPHAVPTTKALVEQQVYSLDSLHKWCWPCWRAASSTAAAMVAPPSGNGQCFIRPSSCFGLIASGATTPQPIADSPAQ